RVKILNGCGITNAADWAAGRLKGPGVSITAVGNADGFNYPKTLIQSSIGTPVALEEAVERLGLRPDQVESLAAAEDADVVVIVGRDYLNLRGKKRERTHSGKK
ncbi:MAG TPA: LytR C-terminal domain-containing protein, partial [bacterium]|nr:LytR C-terminal domain-containing protein [bacterium]